MTEPRDCAHDEHDHLVCLDCGTQWDTVEEWRDAQREAHKSQPCEECHGTGAREVNIASRDDAPEMDVEVKCIWCDGTGEVFCA